MKTVVRNIVGELFRDKVIMLVPPICIWVGSSSEGSQIAPGDDGQYQDNGHVTGNITRQEKM